MLRKPFAKLSGGLEAEDESRNSSVRSGDSQQPLLGGPSNMGVSKARKAQQAQTWDTVAPQSNETRGHNICEFLNKPFGTPVLDLLWYSAEEAKEYYHSLPEDWAEVSKWWARSLPAGVGTDIVDEATVKPAQPLTDGGNKAQGWLDPNVQAWHTTRWNDPESAVDVATRRLRAKLSLSTLRDEEKSEADLLREPLKLARAASMQRLSFGRGADITHAVWALELYLGNGVPSTAVPDAPSSDMKASAVGGAGEQLKAKVSFKNNTYAMRFPRDIGLVALKDRLKQKLRIGITEKMTVRYENRGRGDFLVELDNDQALDAAINQCEEALRIHVESGGPGSATPTEDEALRIAERMVQKVDIFRRRQPEGLVADEYLTESAKGSRLVENAVRTVRVCKGLSKVKPESIDPRHWVKIRDAATSVSTALQAMEQAALDVTFELGDVAPDIKNMGSRVFRQRDGLARPTDDQLRGWKIKVE
ncbi:uncharacterized protein AB675_9583 [Cyphellophora attinorum]|uniref:PB1 domain-containing protein n=1 Tax=Cyphellophora attinorum TaxID=1664694 RepID=A0A0N0NPA0_9EURO|nr:uncharacterized protein AB675_9583 [Phialophora attinorum]KPI42511.1 hypothetical protein AB675_9583 [Phialophora attinorum]